MHTVMTSNLGPLVAPSLCLGATASGPRVSKARRSHWSRYLSYLECSPSNSFEYI